jgi:hypothetical protein
MSIFTLAEIQEQKVQWKAALLALSTGKSYSIGTRTLTRNDINDVKTTLEWLDQKEISLTTGRSGVRCSRVLIRDI